MSLNLNKFKEPLVNPELAVKLKNLGFNYPTMFFYKQMSDGGYFIGSYSVLPDYIVTDYNKYSDMFSIPTLALVQQWFREEHGIHINPFRKDPDSYYVTINYPIEIHLYEQVISHVEKDYNFVLQDGLETAIEILEEYLNKKRDKNLEILKEEESNLQPKLTKDEIFEIALDTLKDFCDEYMYNHFEIGDVDENTKFYKDLGFDELDHVEFIMRVEEELNISTIDIHFNKLKAIGELVDALYNKQKK